LPHQKPQIQIHGLERTEAFQGALLQRPVPAQATAFTVLTMIAVIGGPVDR